MQQTNNHRITALVPMKAHSERIPGKNSKPLCGRPLFHWVLTSLRNSRFIGEIVINTDDEAIAEDAAGSFPGVRILRRPEAIRGDFVSMNDIIAHDLSQSDGDHFLQTHSTNPLLRTDTIDAAIERYLTSLDTYDSLFSVTRYQTRFYWPDGRPINHNPDQMLRTQDLPPIFEENSNLYIFSRDSFARSGNRRIGLRPQMFEMDPLEAVDIDDLQDFELAAMLMRIRLSKESKTE